MTVTDAIKERLDIVSYIHNLVPLKKAGSHFKACCPFHSEDHASFMVSPDRQSWRCYGSCADGGDIFAFAMRYHGWSFREALEELGKLAGVEVQYANAQTQKAETLRGLVQTAADAYHNALVNRPEAAEIRAYLARRGLTPETINAFNLGWHPGSAQPMFTHLTKMGATEEDIIAAGLAVRKDDGTVFDRLAKRLIIPITDERGRAVALAGRRMDSQSEAKYINTPNSAIFDRSRLLFGYRRDAVFAQTAVIVEGYLDVMAAHQAGFTNVVAQMGTGLTEGQLKLLKDTSRIVIALDGDTAGQTATRRGVEVAIQSSRDVRVLTLADGLDPDDVIRESPEQWRDLVEKAEPVGEWLIERECAAIPANAPMAVREAKARELLPLMVAAESTFCRTDNVQMLAIRLRIPPAELVAIAPPKTLRLPEVTPAPIAPRSPLEAYCIRGLLHDEQWFYNVWRIFKDLGIEDFGAADFLDYRPVMEAFLAGIEQFEVDTYDYILSQVDANLLPPFDPNEPPNEKWFIEQALRLRAQRRTEEVTQLLEIGDVEQSRWRLKEKALIQQYRARE